MAQPDFLHPNWHAALTYISPNKAPVGVRTFPKGDQHGQFIRDENSAISAIHQLPKLGPSSRNSPSSTAAAIVDALSIASSVGDTGLGRQRSLVVVDRHLPRTAAHDRGHHPLVTLMTSGLFHERVHHSYPKMAT